MARFYGHFAAAHGTCWLCLLGYAFMAGRHVNAGDFGLYGFLGISALYALLRVAGSEARLNEIERLRRRVERLERPQDDAG